MDNDRADIESAPTDLNSTDHRCMFKHDVEKTSQEKLKLKKTRLHVQRSGRYGICPYG